jgi:RNA polymerase sigma-70 factor (ECF subfamily)
MSRSRSASGCPRLAAERPTGEVIELANESGSRELAVLIHRSAAGDEAAFAELYDATAPRVYGLAVRMLGATTLAEEVTRESYLDVWRTTPRFDVNRNSPMAWIMAIAHHRAIDGIPATRQAGVSSVPGGPGRHRATLGPGAASNHALEVQPIRAALAKLTAAQRDALELVYFHGCAPDEPAELTSILRTLRGAAEH